MLSSAKCNADDNNVVDFGSLHKLEQLQCFIFTKSVCAAGRPPYEIISATL